jgi:stearoyl-CoA desaturase (delta-9 desaturase)
MIKIPDTLKYLAKVNIPVFLLAGIIPFVLDFKLTTYIFFIICYTLIYLISGNIYHRYWSHKQFLANRYFIKITSVLGLFIMVGDPISYAKSHRYHHAHSDTDKDIHSPRHGIFHALIGWMFINHKLPLFLVRDLVTDPKNRYLATLSKHQIKIIWLGIILCYVINIHLFVGLIYSMILGFVMEMLTNAFAHSGKKQIAINNYPIALISLTQLHYEHHTNPLSNKKDMGNYLLMLLEKLKLISRNI